MGGRGGGPGPCRPNRERSFFFFDFRSVRAGEGTRPIINPRPNNQEKMIEKKSNRCGPSVPRDRQLTHFRLHWKHIGVKPWRWLRWCPHSDPPAFCLSDHFTMPIARAKTGAANPPRFRDDRTCRKDLEDILNNS